MAISGKAGARDDGGVGAFQNILAKITIRHQPFAIRRGAAAQICPRGKGVKRAFWDRGGDAVHLVQMAQHQIPPRQERLPALFQQILGAR